MKAPGRDMRIPRRPFEEDPATYFRNLRSNSSEPSGEEKTMKAPGRDMRIPRRPFEEDPATYFRNLRSNSSKPSGEEKAMKAPGRDMRIPQRTFEGRKDHESSREGDAHTPASLRGGPRYLLPQPAEQLVQAQWRRKDHESSREGHSHTPAYLRGEPRSLLPQPAEPLVQAQRRREDHESSREGHAHTQRAFKEDPAANFHDLQSDSSKPGEEEKTMKAPGRDMRIPQNLLPRPVERPPEEVVAS
ncbi:hypothetical protein EUGRSUZ_H03400 [Eucalyptus grandis]|uniref:Uncharacterized protein n=2 Tax=Eucalyptus grandis TaxID=71139 RepID=A0ACC3JU36_EUCGR|nr:hypothetical protein EUGRSUZ_H03400 [Eucalyptus grandis]